MRSGFVMYTRGVVVPSVLEETSMNVRKLTLATLVVLGALAGLLALGGAPALAVKEYVAAGTFGSEGSGNGQFEEPTGVAVNGSSEPLVQPAAGDVYVLDTGNARVEQFSSTGAYIAQWSGSETPAKGFSFSPEGDSQGIAVDGSNDPLDPSAGDVYVADAGNKSVDQFTATGKYKSQLTGTCASPGTCPGEVIPFPGELLGLATDPAGNLWVSESAGNVDEFSDVGAFVQSFNTGFGGRSGLAVDASGNVYPVFPWLTAGRYEAGKDVAEFGREGVTALTANSATGEVLLDLGSSIERFGPAPESKQKPLETFAGEDLSESHGIAVDGASAKDTVYATQRGADDVEIFNDVLFPGVSASYSDVSETGVTLDGIVSPEGEAVTACRFEYGTTTSYGQSVPCEQTLEAINKTGEPVAVSAKLLGLPPAATRHFRLDATNANGTKYGRDVTISRPVIEGEASSNVGSTEATVSAQINPGGEPTGYHVEYGPNIATELSTPEVSAGSADGPVNVVVSLRNLQPSTAYHFRFVASNGLGGMDGGEMTLVTTAAQVTGPPTQSTCPNRTFSGFSAALPDCRAYELVSIPIDETYLPQYDETLGEGGTGEYVGLPAGFRAASNGEAIAYMGGESNSGVGGNGATSDGDGNQYVASRGPGGWEASDVAIPINSNYGAVFREFSPDLKVQAILANTPRNEPLEASPSMLAECVSHEAPGIFSRDATGLHALVTMNQGSGVCFGESGGISADDSHILFESSGPYTPEAVNSNSFYMANLYDSVNGIVHQVNVLPDGEVEQTPYATFGGRDGQISEYNPYANFSGDISSDGSRVIWTALEGSESQSPQPKALYVRQNDSQPQSPVVGGRCATPADACTVQIDEAEAGAPGPGGGGQFWATANNATVVFFTDQNRLTRNSTAAPSEPDLYEYRVDPEAGARGTLVDLSVDGNAGQHADVQGVVGTSEDGSYVYFVADGVLAGVNAEGKAPTTGQPNLYLSHAGTTTFVVTLASGDDTIVSSAGGKHEIGDWQLQPGARTAEVTPDGSAIGFESRLELTGYDNNGIVAYQYENGKPVLSNPVYERLPELFVYEARGRRIFCASCSPTGAPPIPFGAAARETTLRGAAVSVSAVASFMPRWVVGREGTQVYFMTGQPLVANDSNYLQDVYEWQSDGSGGCQLAVGCVKLISSAEPLSNAYFIDSGEEGRDVFFTSRSLLSGDASGETLKLYDARIDGGRSEPSLSCTGTGCQGVPPAPPIFATPSSITFNGVGNFESGPAPAKPKPKSKAKSKKKRPKCKRGQRRKHNRCVKGKARKTKISVKLSHGGGK
jgi:hypothetical protein